MLNTVSNLEILGTPKLKAAKAVGIFILKTTTKKKLEFILRINAKMVKVTFKSCINFLSQLS